MKSLTYASLGVASVVVLISACSTRPRTVTASGPNRSRINAAEDAGGSASSDASAGRDGGEPSGPGTAGERSAGTGGAAAAGGDGAPAGDRCLGVTCEEPPVATCLNAGTRRTHASVGSCVDGTCVYAPRDEPCAFGCDRGVCASDPCVGKTCTTPPNDRCEDDGHLHVHDATGSCSAGACTYASRVLSCSCAADACTTDPCPSVTCDTPPASTCPNGTTRRTFAAIGTCSGGACSYEQTDTPCEFGCSNGTCNPDPCAGVTCTTPPAASCPTLGSRRSYRSPGTCDDGICSYEPIVTNCGSNERCSGGVCIAEPTDPLVPAVTGSCPAFVNGTITFMGLSGIALQAGAKSEDHTAPMVFYWHGTGSFSGEYASMAAPVHAGVLEEGGVLISFQGTTGGDILSGTSIFGAGDFELTDQLVACAVRDHNVDPHRIFTTGCSGGGLFAAAMAARRSSYVAAAATNSGGWTTTVAFQDAYTPALMTMHGKSGVDVVVVDFSTTSKNADVAFKARGGFVINCDHGGMHCGGRDLYPDVWRFFQTHRYGTKPSPWASGLPSGFASACLIF